MNTQTEAHLAHPTEAAPDPAASPSLPPKGRGRRKEVCTDVRTLDPEWRDAVEELIVQGNTFEDVVDLLKERNGPRVTLRALAAFFRSNFDLQQRRAAHLIQEAQKLKAAMANPQTAEGQLADAALFTGLLRLTRRCSLFTVKDAQTLHMQRDNLHLRKRILRLKLQEEVRKKSLSHQRYLFEEARREKLDLENKRFRELLKKFKQDETLPADLYGKIQEIYGIVDQPYLPPFMAAQNTEPPTS